MARISIGNKIIPKNPVKGLIKCCSCHKYYDFEGNIFKHKKDNILVCPYCGLKHKIDFKLFDNRIDDLKKVDRLDLTVFNIGNPAIDRDSWTDVYTLVDKLNPASASGKITSIEIWANTPLSNCEVATFYVVSGNNLSTRDTEAIGAVAAGSKQTFTVDLDAQVGDFIGIYFTAGKIERTSVTGGMGYWYSSGDRIPCTNQAFTITTVGGALSLYGTSKTAADIDIGNPAIYRAGLLLSGYTFIDLNNPTDASGKITSVELYAYETLSNCEVATFYLVSGTNYSTRDYQAIGTVIAGSRQTFAVDLNVKAGDFIGLYFTAGKCSESLDLGGIRGRYTSGDRIPCSNYNFATISERLISLYGTGVTAKIALTSTAAITASTVSTLSRGITEVLTSTADIAVSIIASLTKVVGETHQLLSTAVVTSSITNSLSRGVTEALTSTSAITSSITGRLTRIVNLTSASATVASIISSLSRGITEALTSTAPITISITLALSRGITQALNSTVNGVVSVTVNLSRGITQTLASTANIISSFTSRITKIIQVASTATIVISITAAISRGITETLNSTSAITTSITSALSRGIKETLISMANIATSITGILSRGITAGLTSVSDIAVSITSILSRGIKETLTSTANITVSILAKLTRLGITILLNSTAVIATSITSTLSKGITEALISTSVITTSITSSLSRGIKEALNSTVNIVVSIISRLLIYFKFLRATLSIDENNSVLSIDANESALSISCNESDLSIYSNESDLSIYENKSILSIEE
ncbi:hypothetical protein ES708_10723 [subsurface metagenome]